MADNIKEDERALRHQTERCHAQSDGVKETAEASAVCALKTPRLPGLIPKIPGKSILKACDRRKKAEEMGLQI